MRRIAICTRDAAAAALGLFAMSTASWAFSVTVSNTGVVAITEVYISPAESSDWGSNLLGDRTIEPGRRSEVNVTGESSSCVYDVQVQGDGLHVRTRYESCGGGVIPVP